MTRTVQQVGWPKARVGSAAAQHVGTDYCTYTSQGRLRQHIPSSWHYTTTDLSSRNLVWAPIIRKIQWWGARNWTTMGHPNTPPRFWRKLLWSTTTFGNRCSLATAVNVPRKPRLEKHESFISEHHLYLPPNNLCTYSPCHSTLFQFYLFCKLYIVSDVPLIVMFILMAHGGLYLSV